MMDGQSAARAMGGRRAVGGRARQGGGRGVLAKRDGPRVASIDFGGWDTPCSQLGEYSPLTRNLRLLDRSVDDAEDLARRRCGKQTAVLIVTEFGRTVASTARAAPITALPARRSSPAARCAAGA